MEKQKMIEYILKLMNESTVESVRKLFICAVNILKKN